MRMSLDVEDQSHKDTRDHGIQCKYPGGCWANVDREISGVLRSDICIKHDEPPNVNFIWKDISKGIPFRSAFIDRPELKKQIGSIPKREKNTH